MATRKKVPPPPQFLAGLLRLVQGEAVALDAKIALLHQAIIGERLKNLTAAQLRCVSWDLLVGTDDLLRQIERTKQQFEARFPDGVTKRRTRP